MGLLNRITKAAVAVIAAVAIFPVIVTGAHADEHNGGGGDATLPGGLPIQTDFKMMMNYELGMHCTGFEFAYCCVLPVYNSILAQVVKPESSRNDFPRLLEADPRENTTADVLGRHTVLRDPAELDRNDNFQKYVLRYWHDAQPRNDGRGKPQTSTLISNVEGNSLLSWNTVADSAKIVGFDDPCTVLNPGTPDEEVVYNRGAMETGDYNGSENVVVGDGDYTDEGCTCGVAIDNYQNVVWNHLYIKEVSARGVEGYGGNTGGNSPENLKYRLGIHVDYPTNFGPAGHGMEGLLTFSGDHGTVVFTQMKVLEDLPITLTSPRIWEALGLPLTPFEDTIDFFGNPGLVDEDSVRPYVQMKARLHHADCDGNGNCAEGAAVLDRRGNEVVGFGTAPIDIPNCERCHSAFDSPNSPNVTLTGGGTEEEIAASALVQQEMSFWLAYYPSMQVPGNSDWYARLKGAAVSILSSHDVEHGTSFLAEYPGNVCTNGLDDCDGGPLTVLDYNGDGNPGVDTVIGFAQNTRAGHESVICQKCHADNVIAVVKSANCGPDQNCDPDAPRNQLFSNINGSMLIPPLTEAIHYNHREVSEGGPIDFQDAQGRSGGCQGCHPAHRSDGDMEGYPIDLDGNNFYADSDNRDANGGCFVGRDVHSNPMKDIDGAETPEHLNPVGEWLSENVFNDQNSVNGGLWCTNCHTQAGQQMWKAENVADLVNAQAGDAGHVREPGDITGDDVQDLNDVLAAVNASLGTSTDINQFKSWLDPKGKKCSDTGNSCYEDGDCAGAGATCDALSADGTDQTSAIWQPDPGMCNHAASLLGLAEASPYQDGGVATIEINMSGDFTNCTTGIGLPGPDCFGTGEPSFYICGSLDDDDDVNVALMNWGHLSNGDVCVPDPTDPNDPCIPESPFCTTGDCVGDAQSTLDGGVVYEDENGDPQDPALEFLKVTGAGQIAVPVPMSAATDGRDHWLAPGEPHCADCHEAPYVEQSGNVNAFAPFNYPRKASLMRYSRGHQDITCQGCHESIHGLYPVTPTIDTTSYAQAASLNDDNSHGPLKCGACHDTNSRGVWDEADDLRYDGQRISRNLDAAISWMHTFTEEADPVTNGFCTNCHEDRADEICNRTNGAGNCIDWEEDWLEHGYKGLVSRNTMDQVEVSQTGHVAGDPDLMNPRRTVCEGCHGDEWREVQCNGSDGREWKEHLTEGRVSMKVWEYVSQVRTNSTCGW